VVGLDATDAVEISAKTGVGVQDVLEAIVERLPPPQGDGEAPLQALVVDSWYDPYLGVVVLVRIMDGSLKAGAKIRMLGTRALHDVTQVGIFKPTKTAVEELGPGELGYVVAGIKDIADAKVGDTITNEKRPCDAPLTGFKPSIPVVFCGLFPADAADYEELRESLGRLALNDSSFVFEPEVSPAL